MQSPSTPPMSPYVNPPTDARARGLIMSDDAGAVQVIAHEGGMVDIAALTSSTNRPLKPLPYEPSEPTCAIPGAYDIPVVVDQVLIKNRDVALATTEPGGYVKADNETLTSGYRETHIVPVTKPLSGEPTNGGAVDDRARIEASITSLTELRIQERLDETLQIPPLPEAARKIIALRADPDFEIAALVSIIETDPSMAARIMGWANSAFYHVDPPARSIDDAVMRILGFDTASSMALGLALGESLKLPEAHVRGLPPYWLDAVFTAATMEAFARHIPQQQRPNVCLCYLTGLLANFGTLVLGHVFPPYYQTICELQEANRHIPHTHVDQHVINIPREIIAAALLEAWALPEEVTDAVRFQFANDYKGSNATFVNLLQLARQSLGAQGLNDYPPTHLDEAVPDQLGLSGDEVALVMEQINDSATELDSLAKAYRQG